MLLLVAVFRTSEIVSGKCGSRWLDCVQIRHLLSLNIETMPYYRVLPPLLDKAPSVSSGKLNAGQPSRSLSGKIYLIPGLIVGFAGLTLGLFFLI